MCSLIMAYQAAITEQRFVFKEDLIMRKTKVLDITVGSINYVIISYALTNMTFLFSASLLYILFFASEIWVAGSYWRKVEEETKSKIIATILLLLCFIVHVAMVYSIGRVSGTVIPFRE